MSRREQLLTKARHHRTVRDTLDAVIAEIDARQQTDHFPVFGELRRKLVLLRNDAIAGLSNAALAYAHEVMEEEDGEETVQPAGAPD